MPVGQNTELTIPEAIARGHDVLDVRLTNWGRTVGDSFPIATAAAVLGFSSSPVGVMIGPHSTVDRCWVSWNLQRTIVGTPMWQTRQLSVDTPMFFGTPANSRGTITNTPAAGYTEILSQAQDENTLFFFPHKTTDQALGIYGIESTAFPFSTGYLKADGSAETFDNVPTGQVFWPVLELRFLLKNGVSPLSTKRFPFQNISQSIQTVQPGAERKIVFIPVFGRKDIILTARSDKASTTFRVAALRSVNPTVQIQETTEGLKTTTNANEVVRFQFCGIAADYLVLYVTPTIADSSIHWAITAYD